jgi:hypothetical protein
MSLACRVDVAYLSSCISFLSATDAGGTAPWPFSWLVGTAIREQSRKVAYLVEEPRTSRWPSRPAIMAFEGTVVCNRREKAFWLNKRSLGCLCAQAFELS